MPINKSISHLRDVSRFSTNTLVAERNILAYPRAKYCRIKIYSREIYSTANLSSRKNTITVGYEDSRILHRRPFKSAEVTCIVLSLETQHWCYYFSIHKFNNNLVLR